MKRGCFFDEATISQGWLALSQRQQGAYQRRKNSTHYCVRTIQRRQTSYAPAETWENVGGSWRNYRVRFLCWTSTWNHSDNVENSDSEFSIYNEYNKQLKQLFTDIKHALNPEFWVNPDKILKLEEKQNETSTSCCDS